MNKETTSDTTDSPKKQRLNKLTRILLSLLIATVLVLVAGAGAIYAASPATIRNPKLEHYHFRMQVVADGKAEDFSRSPYQMDYAKGQCTAELTNDPIHFHDNKDQIVHIHWDGMTGGLVLKNYGWNLVGGMNNALGYKLDDLTNVSRISTKGDALPVRTDNANYYVYTYDEATKKVTERSMDDFINQNLEDFFGKKSLLKGAQASSPSLLRTLSGALFPKAGAHSAELHPTSDGSAPETEVTDEELLRINNLIGNVVIFAQTDKPTDAQVQARFDKLEPLSLSTCGG